jgi:hypothetical protein
MQQPNEAASRQLPVSTFGGMLQAAPPPSPPIRSQANFNRHVTASIPGNGLQ